MSPSFRLTLVSWSGVDVPGPPITSKSMNASVPPCAVVVPPPLTMAMRTCPGVDVLVTMVQPGVSVPVRAARGVRIEALNEIVTAADPMPATLPALSGTVTMSRSPPAQPAG